MFTGLVEEIGRVQKIVEAADSVRLSVELRVCAKDLKKGDSLAVNGCCLTVAKMRRHKGRAVSEFDLLRETWNRTNFQVLQTGAAVNLERPLMAGGRFGGHFVTGHVDGIGHIKRWERSGKDWLLEIVPPEELMRYVIPKGSVAIDGISLTVAEVKKLWFRVWIIPHTYEATVLHERTVGGVVNVEVDMLGKYVERFIRYRLR
jgi:riboflavin synthase